jgi:hypothetical protein
MMPSVSFYMAGAGSGLKGNAKRPRLWGTGVAQVFGRD